MLSSFKAVFFDAGGTLFRPYPSVGVIYAETASRYGCKADAEKINHLFHEIWLKRDGLNTLASHSDEKIEKDWWRHLVKEVFDRVGQVDDFDAFFSELYEIFGAPECWKVFPETREVLRELKSRGKFLGIVSNWDSRLFKLCDGLGLRDYFDFVLASAVFGSAKPGAKIFEEALRKAGVDASEAVHIGDSFEDDIQGASKLGIEAILIDRKLTGKPRDRSDFSHVKTIHDLKQLL